jgi:hypothetical protein
VMKEKIIKFEVKDSPNEK